MSGLTSTGFETKTLTEIIDEINASLRNLLGQDLSLDEATVLGIFVGVIADRIVEVWELADEVYGSQYPDSAVTAGLDGVSAITGTVREVATKSTATATLNIDAAVTVPTGSVVSVDGNPLARFVTLADAVGPGPGAQDVAVEMEAEETGPSAAPSGTLTVIETPVAGWNTSTNAADAELGTVIETDAALRLRREDELQAGGAGPLDAIRGGLLQVDDVTEAKVFQNVTLVTDGDGVPGKAFESVVLGGTDQDIIDKIWEKGPAGIETHGGESGTIIDSQGDSHTIEFSRPTEIDIWIIVDVTTDDDYPATGDADIEAALIAFQEASLSIGDDVITTQLFDAVFSIAGVVDVTKLWIGFANPPTGDANLTIGNRELADFDTSRITVTSV